MRDECAGDGDALLLAAGEHAGEMVDAFAEADLLEAGAGAFVGFALRDAVEFEGEGGVFQALRASASG